MEYVTQYTIKQACDIIGVKLPPKYNDIADNVLTNIAIIVNSLAEGGGFILQGKNDEDRAENLAKAMKKNPQFVFAGKASLKLEQIKNVPHVVVKDPYDAMVKLSSHIRNELNLTVVGVTGSLGKTTTKEMIHAVLKQQYVAEKNFGNRNNTKGIFLSLQSVEKDVQFYVQEFGVAIGKKSMESKVNACLPNAAVITNISDPHVDVFGCKENILKEKIKLVTEMKEGSPAFLNYDDPLLKKVTLDNHPIVSYALENKDADYYAENIQFIDDYITFEAVHGSRRTPIVLHSREKHNVANALVAMAVAEWFQMPLEKIVEGIDSFRNDEIRQSLTNIGGYQLYVDCYNTAPVSLLGSVDVLDRLPVAEGGKRIAVLGDIVRLGTEEERIHKEVGEKLAASKLDLVLCFGNKNAKIMAEAVRAAGTAALYTERREELDEWMRWLITKKDVTLIKGPVARLLSKSIDQVFGTSYHIRSEHHELTRTEDYQVDIIFEKEDHSKKTAALVKYRGKEQVHHVPSECKGVKICCIYKSCFAKNQEIKKITIPEMIYNISESAFEECTKLENVSLPATLKVIGENAFNGCTNLKELCVPAGTIDIGEKAFADCKNLEIIEIPESVGNIGKNAFENCSKVKILCTKDSFTHKYAVDHNLLVEIKK